MIFAIVLLVAFYSSPARADFTATLMWNGKPKEAYVFQDTKQGCKDEVTRLILRFGKPKNKPVCRVLRPGMQISPILKYEGGM
jgi:hypothetical protein